MTLKTEAGAIIKKIEEQSNVIVKKITNSQPFERWIKQQINTELQRINNESLSDNFKFLAIIIDTTYQFFKNKSNENKTNLIENCLTNLINNWSDLSEKEIEEISYHLKIYNKTDDPDAQIVLKKFNDIRGEPISFFGDLSKKLVSSCGKSLSKLSINFKTQFIRQPPIEFTRESSLPNPIPFFKNPTLENSINRPVKYKKKIRPRIIEFDEDGIGYDINSLYLYFKEIKRLNNINLEVEPPDRIKKKIFQEELLNKELERLARTEIYESDVNKLKRAIKIHEFDLFASKEEKDTRQSIIERKKQNIKRNRERQKNSKLLIPKILPIQETIDIYKNACNSQLLGLEPPLFETNKDDFLDAYLRTIDYEKFKELIKFSDHILFSINKIKDILKKIDIFSKDLGFFSNYEESLDYYYRRLVENFNRMTVGNFLENSLILFKQKTLALDNNYCLLRRWDKKNKIEFSEPAFLEKFISANNSEQIYKILYNEIKQLLNKKMSILISIKHKKFINNKNLIKKFLYFFDEEYYLTSKKFKKKFIKKIFSNVSELNSVEAIKTILDNLSWRQLFLFHIGIIFLLRKGFRARLSEELFLNLLEDKFNKIDEKQKPNVENIDALYAIKNQINSLKNKIQDHSIDLISLNPLDSRQAIVSRFKNNKEIENLLRNILILSNQASSCINEFNNLKEACQREIEKIPEYGQLRLNKNDVSKVHIPLKWTRIIAN